MYDTTTLKSLKYTNKNGKLFLKGCAGKTKQKTTKKIAKDAKDFEILQNIEKYSRRLKRF